MRTCTYVCILYSQVRTSPKHHSLPLHNVIKDEAALSPTADQQHPVVGGEAEPRGSTGVRSRKVGHLALRLTAPEADTPVGTAGGYHPSLVR